MKAKGPLITLVVGAALAGGLLVVNDQIGRAAPVAAPVAATEPAATKPASKAPAAPAPAVKPKGRKATAAWWGPVDGNRRITVRIVARNGTTTAYVCDGKKVEAWLRGVAIDGELQLVGGGKDVMLGRFANGRATGDVRVGKRSWTFDVPAVKS